MADIFNWVLHNLVGRIDGPLKFRLILQPAVAIFFSTRAGLQDAREKRDPYFWAIFTEPRQRGKRGVDRGGSAQQAHRGNPVRADP